MIVQIHREPDTGELIAQVSVGRVKTYITVGEQEPPEMREAIRLAAECMGGDGQKAIDAYSTLMTQMTNLSTEMARRAKSIEFKRNPCLWDTHGLSRSEVTERDTFLALDAALYGGQVLTHAEIYWLDWFIRKYKLLGEN